MNWTHFCSYSVWSFLYLLLQIHQDRHLCDSEFYQWMYIFQNLCSVSPISLKVCFWMEDSFNLLTQCEWCTWPLLQWRSCGWRHVSDIRFYFLLFEMVFHDTSENFQCVDNWQTQKKIVKWFSYIQSVHASDVQVINNFVQIDKIIYNAIYLYT